MERLLNYSNRRKYSVNFHKPVYLELLIQSQARLECKLFAHSLNLVMKEVYHSLEKKNLNLNQKEDKKFCYNHAKL